MRPFIVSMLLVVAGFQAAWAEEPTPSFAGAGFRAGVVGEARNAIVSAGGGSVQFVWIGEGRRFQHGPAVALTGVWRLPGRGESSLQNAALDLTWRGEWHRGDTAGLGGFGALFLGPALATGCTGDFCSPLRIGVGGEAGWRFPLNDRRRLEVLIQLRYRSAWGGNPLTEVEPAFLLGLL